MSVRWRRAPSDSAAGERALGEALRLNPSLRVLSGCGIYDLVCDYYANRWVAEHLDPAVRRNVTVREYGGGHAMYTDPSAHLQLRQDVAAFIAAALVRTPERP